MTFQNFAAIEPEGKDYVMLLAGFLLGYMGSHINSRYDRFCALRTECARLVLVLHYHVNRARDGVSAFTEPRSQLNSVSNEFMLEGHVTAHAFVEQTINGFAQLVKRCGIMVYELPENHATIVTFTGWDRSRIAIHIAGLEIVRSRDQVARQIMRMHPTLRVFLPFGIRWLGPVLDEIETVIHHA